jgi:hypothetical protein
MKLTRSAADRRRPHPRPGIEGLEARSLPSSLAAPHTTASRSAAPPWVNPTLLNSIAAELYAPITTTEPTTVGNQQFAPGTFAAPQPTAVEVRRQTIWAQFTGRYYVGPPRFSNQAATIHIYSHGKNVSSSDFALGRAQVLLFPPADPTAQPNTNDPVAGQVVGLASLFAANLLQSGTLAELDVTNLPGVASNNPATLDHGLPAHLSFVVDAGGVNGGFYATPAYYTVPSRVTTASGQAATLQGGAGGAVAFDAGAGVIDITYLPDHRSTSGASQSGKVIVRIQGLLHKNGAFNPLAKGIN